MSRAIAVVLVVGLVAGIVVLDPPEILSEWVPFLFPRSHGWSNDRNASSTLKTIGTAQADFRANDRDGNGINDFWRGDIAGLYVIEQSGVPIKLIEVSAALADDRPLFDVMRYGVRSAKAGYLYRSLMHADEAVLSPIRFAACAYPEVYRSSGLWTFIIDEGNTMYRKDLGRGGSIESYPRDPVAEGWERVD